MLIMSNNTTKTLDLMEGEVMVVKKEHDVEYLFHMHSTTASAPDIKCEPPAEMMTETEFAVVLHNPTTSVGREVTGISGNVADNAVPSPYRSELVESFVIYELEPTVAPNTVTTTATTRATTTRNITGTPSSSSSSSSPALAPATPPPTVLNTKLRKRAPTDATAKPALSGEMKLPPAKLLRSSPPAGAELKVKCFCRLANLTGIAAAINCHDLRQFYEEMFNETRQLSREQQRAVKLALLEAISQAEEDVEAGKCCDKCCS